MPDLTPLRLLIATIAGFVSREQAKAIAYLVEENRVLRNSFGKAELVHRPSGARVGRFARRAAAIDKLPSRS